MINLASNLYGGNESILRIHLTSAYRELIQLGLNRGTSGNCSVRLNNHQLLITPSGVPLEKIQPEAMVVINMDGVSQGEGVPSSEWRFHTDIMKCRDDVQAVVHTHSIAATALACLRKDIPSFHYMVAVAGGSSIRCAPYELFGTKQLSERVLEALRDRRACLMGNHGMVAVGRDLRQAVQIALEVETLADQYLRALSFGEPDVLSEREMRAVLEKFKNYGVNVNT